jgi:hypothetical protein
MVLQTPLEKLFTKIGLVEWLKVNVLISARCGGQGEVSVEQSFGVEWGVGSRGTEYCKTGTWAWCTFRQERQTSIEVIMEFKICPGTMFPDNK